MQFNIAYNFHCSPFELDQAEFFELCWQFNRIAKEKEKEAKAKQGGSGNMNLESLFLKDK